MSKEKIQHFTALEVGTSKVAMAIGRAAGEKLEVIAFAQSPHRGMHQGQIIDPQEIISAIQKIKSELELTANLLIEDVYVSVADQSIETINAKGVTSIHRAVTQKNIDTVLQEAQDLVQIRSDREILHVFPQFFRMSGVKYSEPPIKEKGNSIEVQTAVVVVSKKLQQSVIEMLETLQMSVVEFVAMPYASSIALLQKDEKEGGVAVVDLGATLTNIIAYKGGKMVLTTALPVGGANFTNDLAVGLRTPQTAAEKIKKNHGAALVDLVSEGEKVEIESLRSEPARWVDARFVCEILEARAEETLGIILRKLNDEDILGHLKKGIILTGGASQLPGFPELGEFTFDLPLRRGGVQDILTTNPLAQSPAMSTVMGLLHYARNRHSFVSQEFSLETFKDSLGRIKNFFENLL